MGLVSNAWRSWYLWNNTAKLMTCLGPISPGTMRHLAVKQKLVSGNMHPLTIQHTLGVLIVCNYCAIVWRCPFSSPGVCAMNTKSPQNINIMEFLRQMFGILNNHLLIAPYRTLVQGLGQLLLVPHVSMFGRTVSLLSTLYLVMCSCGEPCHLFPWLIAYYKSSTFGGPSHPYPCSTWHTIG